MSLVSLNEAEKVYIIHGVEENFRCDGRSRQDYRPLELEMDIVSNANGSARLRLANSDILVCVKVEIDTPLPEAPKDGKVEYFVDCSANATPAFEGRGGEHLAAELSRFLSLAHGPVFNLSKLCIVPGQSCWKLFVDVLILECGGNLFDAVSLAAKAALCNTSLPNIVGTYEDGQNIDLQISDDPFDTKALDASDLPVLVSMCKIGNSYVADPTIEEEICGAGCIVVSVTPKGNVTAVLKKGAGSFMPDTLNEIIMSGSHIGILLNKALNETLIQDMSSNVCKQQYGFLK
ncbi:exosome complex component RRP42 isoform X2 [Myzus persicae]|nr:exosome complex component RRP42 isoform X2 [Myzus persicae]XP_022179636.1 exosome complex component RRP42 isoform X2 [Myzus persicae]XP_022179637.1 exosome complex component RRP42 isoform X2 [Myzus persicae]XP_022179638.1 exosome complex component RRP42 isoform X2 [Myzus persicae]